MNTQAKTPRTDGIMALVRRMFINDGNERYVQLREGAQLGIEALETELSAANERVKELEALVKIPDGWQLAPKQWTTEMAHAGYEVHKNNQIMCYECGQIYTAMIAAIPEVPK